MKTKHTLLVSAMAALLGQPFYNNTILKNVSNFPVKTGRRSGAASHKRAARRLKNIRARASKRT